MVDVQVMPGLICGAFGFAGGYAAGKMFFGGKYLWEICIAATVAGLVVGFNNVPSSPTPPQSILPA